MGSRARFAQTAAVSYTQGMDHGRARGRRFFAALLASAALGPVPAAAQGTPGALTLGEAAWHAVRTVDPPGDEVVRYRVPTAGAPSRGAPSPLVTIVQFGDYACPFTARVHDALANLLARYPDEVRWVFRHRPLPGHPLALPAAHAAEEVRLQAADAGFWRFHDALLAGSGSAPTEERLVAAAQGVDGVDAERVVAAARALRHGDRLEQDRALAERFGVGGTPMPFVNGRPLPGALPLDRLEAVVQEEIALAARRIAAGDPRGRLPALLLAGGRDRVPPTAGTPSPGGARGGPDPAAIHPVPVTGDEPTDGPADALVTIVEFSDFECPYCARVVRTLRQLRALYRDQVRVVWKHHPLPFHRNAEAAAIAAHEVHRQAGDAAFWRYHDRLFDDQRTLGRSQLVRRARGIPGVDPGRVLEAVRRRDHARAIDAQAALARSLGANGTPAFFVNGRYLPGAQPLEAFIRVVDEELERARAALERGVPRARLYETLVGEDAAADTP